jgi:hypothetical protein
MVDMIEDSWPVYCELLIRIVLCCWLFLLAQEEEEEEEEEEEDDDDAVIKDDLVDEEGSDAIATHSGSDTETKGEEENPSVRKRKPRKAD